MGTRPSGSDAVQGKALRHVGRVPGLGGRRGSAGGERKKHGRIREENGQARTDTDGEGCPCLSVSVRVSQGPPGSPGGQRSALSPESVHSSPWSSVGGAGQGLRRGGRLHGA